MTNFSEWLESSEEKFGRTFRHCAYFNKRLRTTGGRYLFKVP